MPTVAIRLDDDIKARLETLAEVHDRSPHYLMKEAIEEYVDEKEAENSIYNALLERWREYELTGETIAGDSVKTWIDALPNE